MLNKTRLKATAKMMKIKPLKKCPGCGGDPDVQKRRGQVQITCFKFGCIQIIDRTLTDATTIWNEKRFAEATQ